MRRFLKALPFFLAVSLTLMSCSKPYVGEKVSYNWQDLSRVVDGRPCFAKTKTFDFHFTVQKTEEPDIYVLQGYAVYKGSGFWTKIEEPVFFFLPVKDGKILDYISYIPQSNWLYERIFFRKTFSCPGGLDAVIMSHRLLITDCDSPC